MICSTLCELVRGNLPVSQLLDSFVKTNDLQTIQVGRYELGDKAYISVQEYKTHENLQFEAHKEWIDIQLIVSGCERILTASVKTGKPETAYTRETDVRFYHCTEQIKRVDLYPDQLVILFPEDLHAPSNSISASVPVRKVVFKIPVAMWNKDEVSIYQEQENDMKVE